MEIKDRSKDIIISGRENISSLEVEDVLYHHSDVDEAAVIAFCREQMAHFKAPKRIIFTPLPKTSTGKVQKFVLCKQLG